MKSDHCQLQIITFSALYSICFYYSQRCLCYFVAGTVLTLGPVWVIPTLSTGGSVLQALCTQPLFMRGRMLLQTHDAIMLNIVALLQHLLSFDMHLLCFFKKNDYRRDKGEENACFLHKENIHVNWLN